MRPMLNPYQHSVHGLLVASGRASWKQDKNGGFYHFSDTQSFKWFLHPKQVKKLEIDEQDLLDCVEQIEKDLGDPSDYRLKMGRKDGLVNGEGYTHVGIKVVSKSNPTVICLFTPVSDEYDDTAGFFEWYYRKPTSDDESQNVFMARYDALIKSQNNKPKVNPYMIVPSHEEAELQTSGLMNLGLMHKEDKETFVSMVWEYHKTKSASVKEEIEGMILQTWQQICETPDANLANQKFGRGSSIADAFEDIGFLISKVDVPSNDEAHYYLKAPERWSAEDIAKAQRHVEMTLGNRYELRFLEDGSEAHVKDIIANPFEESIDEAATHTWAILSASSVAGKKASIEHIIKSLDITDGAILVAKMESGTEIFISGAGDASGYGAKVGDQHGFHHDQRPGSKGILTVQNLISIKGGKIAKHANNVGLSEKRSPYVFK